MGRITKLYEIREDRKRSTAKGTEIFPKRPIKKRLKCTAMLMDEARMRLGGEL